MKTLFLTVAFAAAGLALAAVSADAAPKGKKTRAPAPEYTQRSWDGYVDPRLGPFGPNNTVIFSNRVIGMDPDPNIRAAILKDISNIFGGSR